MPAGKNKLEPLTEAEFHELRALFAPDHGTREGRFIGWMLSSGRFSAKAADDVRAFVAAESRPAKQAR